ncbi:MAG: hypothetical protein AB7Q29_06220 [Vicinamibacterales bacterium]
MRGLILFAILLAGQNAGAQNAGAQDAGAQDAGAKSGSGQRDASYTYNPQGRRDPFVSLMGTGGDAAAPPRRMADGVAGMRVEDMSVRGIMQTRSQLVAMVQGTDNRTYVLHEGDRIADGIVKAVVADGLVMLQDVDDPRAPERTREVRKLLKSFEDNQR